MDNDDVIFTQTGSYGWVDTTLIREPGHIIDYHSEPDGTGQLFDLDSIAMAEVFQCVFQLKRIFDPSGKFYFVIYTPKQDNSVWYTFQIQE